MRCHDKYRICEYDSARKLIDATKHKWTAPVMAVPKRDGMFRICGDYKVNVNSVMDIDQYPFPKPKDMFAILAGGKKFLY